MIVGAPLPHGAQVELGAELQGAGGAHRHAVAAVHARTVGELGVVFGADAGIETASCHCDGEGVLGIVAAGLDALVAEHAAVVRTDVQIVLDAHRFVDALGLGAQGQITAAVRRALVAGRVGAVGS